MNIFGHRGAASLAPENTLLSFNKALSCGVDGLECDLQLSRDREVVICHDERVDRTSNGVGWIKNFTLKGLKELDFGSWFPGSTRQEIPTLRELLDMLQGINVELNLEIKSGFVSYPGLGQQVVQLLYEYGRLRSSILSSFDHQAVFELKQLYPETRTAILYDCAPVQPWLYARSLGAQYIHPAWYYVTPALVAEAAGVQIGVNTWTVNDEFAAEKVRSARVERIITDFPQHFRKNEQGEALWVGR